MNRKVKLSVLSLVLVVGGLVLFFALKEKDFFYVGTVEATQVDISPRIASVVAFVDAKEGQKVQLGQKLFTLAGEDLKLAAEVADSDFRRAQKLFKNGSISEESYLHLRFKKDETRLKVEWTEVKAPIQGTVLNTYREVGEWVSPGTKLLTLAHLQEVWAVVYVAQPMLAKLSLGQKVEAILPEVPGQKWSGTIVRISDEAEFTPKNVQTRAERTRLVFGIKILFENKNEFLKPGMSVEVRL
jgi:HlyD family secretion protein